MASVINQIKVGGVDYAIAHTAVAVCNDAANVVNKTAQVITNNDTDNADVALVAGVCLTAFFTNGNTATNSTLNVNGTGAYPLIIINYNEGPTRVPPGYLQGGVPYMLFFNGAAWQFFYNQPSVQINTWGTSD
jgi:hypothetical protein